MAKTKKLQNFVHMRDTRRIAAQASRYSQVIGILKWLLPAVVLGVFLILLAWPLLSSNKITEIVAASMPDLKVDNLRLTGIGSNNQPYKLTAKKALSVSSSNTLIDLEKPEGEISLGNDSVVTGVADIGRYDQAQKRLWLGGNVQFFHDDGYEFLTSEAQVDMERNNAWGTKPVVIEGAFGRIDGQGFRLLKGGKVVVVTGHSKAILNVGNDEQKTREKKK